AATVRERRLNAEPLGFRRRGGADASVVGFVGRALPCRWLANGRRRWPRMPPRPTPRPDARRSLVQTTTALPPVGAPTATATLTGVAALSTAAAAATEVSRLRSLVTPTPAVQLPSRVSRDRRRPAVRRCE